MTSSTVIAHELSRDFATAILSVKDHSPCSLDELKEICLEGSTGKEFISRLSNLKSYVRSLGSDGILIPRAYKRKNMDLKLELIAVPVTDVDRAKAFYEKVGFNPDQDHTVSEDLRFVQLTPPGSACSICIGKGLTQLKPGSIDMIVLVVGDADAARNELISRGIDASEVDEQPWGRFVYITDPDGNKWSLQELPKRN